MVWKCIDKYVSDYWLPAPENVTITYRKGELCSELIDEYLMRSYAECYENYLEDGKKYKLIGEARFEAMWGWLTEREHKKIVRDFRRFVECLEKREVPHVLYENDNPDFYAVVVEVYRKVRGAEEEKK